VKEHLFLKLMPPQEEPHRVYDEWPILLQDLDHAAPRKFGRKPQSHAAFVGRSSLREVEGAAGDSNQSVDAMGLERPSLCPVEKGSRESSKQGAVSRAALRICFDGSFQNLPGFFALNDHGRSWRFAVKAQAGGGTGTSRPGTSNWPS
jgi:hypothetical protein